MTNIRDQTRRYTLFERTGGIIVKEINELENTIAAINNLTVAVSFTP